MEIETKEFSSKEDLYPHICTQLHKLAGESQDMYAFLSNASAILKLFLEHTNWVGFYLLKGETLTVGPFQGKPAVEQIPIGKGVCGTAVRLRQIQRVDDVRTYCNHIACDTASSSEIVVPIFIGKEIFGVIDADSPVYGRFDEKDEKGLAEVAAEIAGSILQKRWR